ncbi:TBC1 domain family member 22B isoform X1 [Acyrthosiphon pisum]|uniref:Rab-GAP TBC domain-containing protein n=1 Tax=Acyrthosiphon pisum TaxID=7029 RepID=A0A8R2ACM6_ACYPI|nr:TBC1 domain family member 22B isoform X1 [Acyrthosiphon pisum]|eukprot:XP_001948071.2 PREDICTED: TBC1 domain family member 22B isoform X1 [Acyrthosiphon pisum]
MLDLDIGKMGDHVQKYVNDNDMNLKNSFWKKNIRNLPGRASPKKESKSVSSSASTSFDDFQESVSDAWEIEAEDEILRISDVKISKRVAHSAAVNVINNHKASIEEIHKSKNYSNSDPQGESSSQTYKESRHTENRVNFLNSEVDTNKLTKFQVLLESNLLNLEDLKKLSWSGVPVEVRPMTWRLLAGYLPTSTERRQEALDRKRIDYANLVKQYYDTDKDEVYKDTYRQIHIDIPRMSTPLFQQTTVQEMFERILFIWAIRHPASGYVQGMNDLVTPFYVVFLQEYLPIGTNIETLDVSSISKKNRDSLEADSFWCLSKFLDGIQDNYIFAQLGIQYKVNQLKELIQRIDGTLHGHLMKHGIDYLQFSFRWMNNLLTRELPLRCSIRLWDTYLAESDCFAIFQLYVCAAFLLHWRQELLEEKDFQGLMIMLQNLQTQNWTDTDISLLVAEAYKLKFTFADAPNHLTTKR